MQKLDSLLVDLGTFTKSIGRTGFSLGIDFGISSFAFYIMQITFLFKHCDNVLYRIMIK